MRLRQRFRYHFDNLMARGVGAQILLLAGVDRVDDRRGRRRAVRARLRLRDDQGNQDSLGVRSGERSTTRSNPGNLAAIAAVGDS